MNTVWQPEDNLKEKKTENDLKDMPGAPPFSPSLSIHRRVPHPSPEAVFGFSLRRKGGIE